MLAAGTGWLSLRPRIQALRGTDDARESRTTRTARRSSFCSSRLIAQDFLADAQLRFDGGRRLGLLRGKRWLRAEVGKLGGANLSVPAGLTANGR